MDSVIYITGVSASGKTTFSNTFFEKGYRIIHLDEFIEERVVPKFKPSEKRSIYFNLYSFEPKPYFERHVSFFVRILRKEILKFDNVVVEGMIKNKEMLEEIFENLDLTVYYIKPKSQLSYKEKIIERFQSNPAELRKVNYFRTHGQLKKS